MTDEWVIEESPDISLWVLRENGFVQMGSLSVALNALADRYGRQLGTWKTLSITGETKNGADYVVYKLRRRNG